MERVKHGTEQHLGQDPHALGIPHRLADRPRAQCLAAGIEDADMLGEGGNGPLGKGRRHRQQLPHHRPGEGINSIAGDFDRVMRRDRRTPYDVGNPCRA